MWTPPYRTWPRGRGCRVPMTFTENGVGESPTPSLRYSSSSRLSRLHSYGICGSFAVPYWPERTLGSSSNLLDALVQPPPKQRAQRDAVGVSHARGHFVDAGIRRLQKMHGALDAQALDVGQRRGAEHVLHAAGECSLA